MADSVERSGGEGSTGVEMTGGPASVPSTDVAAGVDWGVAAVTCEVGGGSGIMMRGCVVKSNRGDFSNSYAVSANPPDCAGRRCLQSSPLKAVRGTRDLLPPKTALWNRIEQTATSSGATALVSLRIGRLSRAPSPPPPLHFDR